MKGTSGIGFLAQPELNKRHSLDLSLFYRPQSQSQEVLARVTEKAKDLQLQALNALEEQTAVIGLKNRNIALLENQLEAEKALHQSETKALEQQNSALQKKLEEKEAELQKTKEAALTLHQTESELSALKALRKEEQLIAKKEKLKLKALDEQVTSQESALIKIQEILKKTELALNKSNFEKQAALKKIRKLEAKCEKAESFQIFVLKKGYLQLPKDKAYTPAKILEDINYGCKIQGKAPYSKTKDAEVIQDICKRLNKIRLRKKLEEHGFSGADYSKYL